MASLLEDGDMCPGEVGTRRRNNQTTFDSARGRRRQNPRILCVEIVFLRVSADMITASTATLASTVKGINWSKRNISTTTEGTEVEVVTLFGKTCSSTAAHGTYSRSSCEVEKERQHAHSPPNLCVRRWLARHDALRARSRSHSGKECAGADSVEARQEHKAGDKIEVEEGNTNEKEKPRPPTRRRHTCGSPAYDLQLNVGIPEEVQPATSDTMKVPTCQTLRTPPRLKNIGGLSSFGVGARWCVGQWPASFGVGRPCGG